MQALYNNHWLEDSIDLKINDRALQFGDGLFETIIVKNGVPRYLEYHYERLLNGANILKLNLKWQDFASFSDQIAKFLQELKISESNIKLMVWRKASDLGGYTFDKRDSNFLIIHRSFRPMSKIIEQADFARTVTFNYSQFSAVKTLNSLPYILASNEKRERKLDEIIVLNTDGYVCECSSSNIFWMKNDSVFTPPIKSGCLDGIMRRVIMEKLANQDREVIEKLASEDEIKEADAIFATNSLGIRFFRNIANIKLDIYLINMSVFDFE